MMKPPLKYSTLILSLMMLVLLLPLRAQDALNLPADLYVLLNSGVVQRYGLGAAGVTNVTDENTFVVDFGIAPDGDLIAYRTETTINVMSLSNAAPPRTIEEQADVPPYRGRGDTIKWSPDQQNIAYTTTYGARVYFNLGDVAAYADLREGLFVDLVWSPDSRFLAGQTDADVWWVYRRDATTMTLASVIPQSNGIAWVGGGQLVFAPPDGGLFLMDLDQANAQSTILGTEWQYYLPTLNADDALVFFARDKVDTNTPPNYGRLQALARGAAEVTPVSETPVLTTNVRWAPGGSLLMAFDGGVIALYDPLTGQGFPLPISGAVAYSWGRFNPQAFFATQVPAAATPTQEVISSNFDPVNAVVGVLLPYDAFFLAFGEFNQPQIWRLPADASPAFPLTAVQGGVSEYAIAPDLSALAFVSDRQLWLYNLLTEQVQAIADIESVGFVTPSFSPDAQRIAYTDGGIRIIGVDGGEAQWVLPDAPDAEQPSFYGEPEFSADGQQLLVSELRPGTNGVHGILTLDGVRYQRLETEYGARALWLSDGSVVTYGYSPQTTPPAEQQIVRFASGAFDSGETIYTLPLTTRIETIIESVRGEIRLIAREGDAPRPQMIDVAFATDENATITDLPAILAPRLSYDGGFVAGYLTQTEVNGIVQGALTIFNAESAEQYLLGSPTSIWGFQWSR
ncbi:MAG: hypothetical protein SF123_25735 [Chloroflexota bacterium]|nr:hypothetical protein [Chloroflexota bacterium]